MKNALDSVHFWGETLDAEPDAVAWVWEGYLAAGDVTLLTSQWKSGKTTLISILLSRLNEGGELAGLPVRPSSPPGHSAKGEGRAIVVSEEPRAWVPCFRGLASPRASLSTRRAAKACLPTRTRGALGSSTARQEPKRGETPREHAFAALAGLRETASWSWAAKAWHPMRVKSYNEPGHAHELTFSCFRRLPLLSRDRTRQWFVEALVNARSRLDFALWAYVIMPEHVHVLLWPHRAVYEVRLIRTALKVPVQRKALAFVRLHAADFLEHLRDEQPGGEVHYRFWQRGGGYDRNVTDLDTARTMIDYIHNNPVRRGLVERAIDWPWSSARFYAGSMDVPLLMDPLVGLPG